MSAISNLPSLPMTTLSADLFKKVSGPATVRNLAKALYAEKADGIEQAVQTGKPSQAAVVYDKNFKDYSALIGANSAKKTSYTPQTANEAAAKGIPTHGFFYHDIDSLAKLAADEDSELDSSFAKDALDFFTGGNYTDVDVEKLQGEMTTALRELGKQVSETGKVDVSKLESRVNINGAEVSLADLADFQKMGQKLSPVFDGISADNTRFQDMQAAAKMSVARLMGQNFGKSRGEIGYMFGEAMNRLYEKGMDKINDLYTDAKDGLPASAASENAAALRNQVSGMFSNMDTSSKSALGNDFSQKLNVMRTMMTQRDNQFGVPVGYRTANEAARNIGLYFSALYKML